MISTFPEVASRFTKRMVIASQLMVLVWLVATEDLSPVGVLLLSLIGMLGVAVAASLDWPFGSLLLLIGCSAAPQLTVTILGLHLRPEHIAVFALAAGFLLMMWRNRAQVDFNWRLFDYSLVAYISLNFLSSLATSPQPAMTLRWATLNAIVVAPYFLIRVIVRDETGLYRAFHFLLWIGWAESVYGLVCFLSLHLFQTSFGVVVGQYGELPGIYGTQYEANLFGSYTACCAVMSLAALLLGPRQERLKYSVGFALALSAMLVSLARSVLIAFPLAALVVVWIALRKGTLRFQRLVPLGAGIGLLLLLISPVIVDSIRERFSTMDPTEILADPTSLNRIVQTVVAVENIQAHPILGTGTASFQLLFDWDDYIPGMQGDYTVGGWVGNTPLRILHDTGAVGLAAFLIFIAGLAFEARKSLVRAEDRSRTVLVALAGGTVLYAITFQATEATMLAFTWVHLGLLATVVQLNEGRTKSQPSFGEL